MEVYSWWFRIRVISLHVRSHEKNVTLHMFKISKEMNHKNVPKKKMKKKIKLHLTVIA